MSSPGVIRWPSRPRGAAGVFVHGKFSGEECKLQEGRDLLCDQREQNGGEVRGMEPSWWCSGVAPAHGSPRESFNVVEQIIAKHQLTVLRGNAIPDTDLHVERATDKSGVCFRVSREHRVGGGVLLHQAFISQRFLSQLPPVLDCKHNACPWGHGAAPRPGNAGRGWGGQGSPGALMVRLARRLQRRQIYYVFKALILMNICVNEMQIRHGPRAPGKLPMQP